MKILIVDDNNVNLSILSIMLEKLGFDVTLTSSPNSALKILSTFQFDLIMVDYHMPEMTGAELTSAIRFFELKNSIAPTSIIATSVDYSYSVRASLSAAGTNTFLNKPHSMTQLHDAICVCLDQSSVAV